MNCTHIWTFQQYRVLPAQNAYDLGITYKILRCSKCGWMKTEGL